MLVQPKKFYLSILLALLLSLTASYADWPQGDLDGDYRIDCNDLYLFTQQWLDGPGCSGNGCADFDGVDGVDAKDFALLAQHWLEEYDNDPPTPNPATWDSVPYTTGSDSIAMTADAGYDDTTPIQYYFDETSGNPGGSDSGWQTSPTYEDTGLTPETQYTYTVQMRDAMLNTGTASAPASATTEAYADTDPPTPIPATWATAPHATDIDTISMTATTGYDVTGPVEYFFNETSDNPGGSNSTWQTSPTYTDTGLSPNTQYTYTVQMRDAIPNTGTASAPASATTDSGYDLFINEFMASNNSTFEDPHEAGEFPDWIEIYNASSSTISLAGMYLTDNKDVPNKWQIPTGVTVSAGGFRTFTADGDDEQGALHTNFKISAGGDDIYLFDTDATTLIDSVDFDEQVTDVSYGRYTNGSPNWQFMGTPTVNASNVSGYLGQVGDTVFSVDRGFYDSPFQVRLKCETSDATIRYTTDGSDPVDPNGSIYDDNTPIQITGTTVLRAKATKGGWLPSNIDTQTYIFVSEIVNQSSSAPAAGWPTSSVNGQRIDYGMDTGVTGDPVYSSQIDDSLLAIPTICLTTDIENLFDPTVGLYVNCGDYGQPGWERGPAWRRPVSVELINPDGSKGFQINAGFGMRGVTSCKDSNPKHAFRLFFSSNYGGDGALEYPLFGDEGVDRFENVDLRCEQNWSWNMDNSEYHTAVREVFSRDLQGLTGEPYSRSRYYHLYLNGVYWGLYQTQERANSNFGQSYFGGDSDDYDVVKPNRSWPRGMECSDGTFAAYKRLWQDCQNGFDTDQKYYEVQGLNTDGTVNPNYERLVDVNNLINYMIGIYYTGDHDAPVSGWHSNNIPNNFFGMYNRENPDGFKFFRHDGEHAMAFEYYSINQDRTGPYTASALMSFTEGCLNEPYPPSTCIGFNPQTIHQYLMVHPEYKMKFADKVHKHFFNNGLMTPTGAQDIFAARVAEIDMAIIAESARWGNSSRNKDTWLNRIDVTLNDHLPYRTDIVLDQIKNDGWYPNLDAPELSINGSTQHGGLITPPDSLAITAPAGTIYYTLDGTDPRTPLSGTPRGSTYSGTITLNQPTKVMARAYSGGTWSALTEAIYDIGVLGDNLRITEIMYHPFESGDPDDPNTEYIEVKNTSGSTINLRWAQFTKGIRFTFPNISLAPGEYTVVAKDISVFTAKYGGGINIAGQYTGSLDNSGERIRLEDAIGIAIQDFRYKDGWRSIVDGDGYSLTINNENNPDLESWNEKESWSASTYFDGTPGVADNGPKWGDIVINEVLAHQDSYPEDWIELYNTTDSAIDITGWYLSDSDANLNKYQIPSTTIPAYGYVIFTESENFGLGTSDPGALIPFALSENGDQVYLTGKEDGFGDLTGYREMEEFGPSERDVAFGRHLKSTGSYNFVPMSYQTPGPGYIGEENAYPKVGPVVITEIMYKPEGFWGDWDAEYIELCNISASTVNLYDANGVTWKITDGISFEFPPSISIPAGGYVILVKDTIAFYTQFPSIPGGAQIFQWTSGKLNDDGEKVEISMPGEMDGLGVQQYIRVDRVNYSDGKHPEDFDGGTDPWPIGANGTGYSLTKVNNSLYGNDPNAWGAWAPSPGEAGTAPAIPSKPVNPSPANGSGSHPTVLSLTWDDGGSALSYDVYFGIDSTPDAGEFQTNTTGETFDPGTLLNDTTYYWRIDAANLEGTVTGDVWSFTTEPLPAPQKAINPDPTNGATGQSTSITITWENGGDAADYDVYFGTDSTPDAGEFQTNTTSNSYNTGSLAFDTIYYWRIDAKNAVGTATGDIWSFRTEPITVLVDLDADDLTLGTLSAWDNDGTLGGSFGNDSTSPTVEMVDGKKAVTFDGSDKMKSSFTSPGSITGNESYTVATWAYNPSIDTEECLVNWAHRGGPDGTCAQQNYGTNGTWGAMTHWGTPDIGFDGGVPSAGDWHHLAVTFNGSVEIVYVDGVPNATESKTLNLHQNDSIYLGYADGDSYPKWLTGSIASVKIYNDALSEAEIGALMTTSPPLKATNPYPTNGASGQSIELTLNWSNGVGATDYDVYFGTDSTPDATEFEENITAQQYDPGTLLPYTTYYWRIDANNSYGTTTGDVWNFTTGDGATVTLVYDDFESGFGNYTNGGGDCSLYTYGTYAHQGTNAANIQDNSGDASAFSLTNGIDVDTPGYTDIQVDFWFWAQGMESGEDFNVQFYNGSSWQTVATYISDTDFVNGQFYNEQVSIPESSYNFPNNMRIKFQCDATSNTDDVYIDEVTITAN